MSEKVSANNHTANSVVLLSLLIVIAGTLLLLISGNLDFAIPGKAIASQILVQAKFTEQSCMEKLQIPESFLKEASYVERRINYNIDRSYSDKPVLWKVYSLGKLGTKNYMGLLNIDDNVLVEALPPLSQKKEKLVYIVFSDELQGCGKIGVNNVEANPRDIKPMKCKDADVYIYDESTDQTFYRYLYIKGADGNSEVINYVSKPFQIGKMRRSVSLLNILGCF